jgi:hypothetical protein
MVLRGVVISLRAVVAPLVDDEAARVVPSADQKPAITGSAELKGARKTFKDPAGNLRFRAGIGPERKQSQAQNTRQVPRNRHTTIPNDSGPASACFDDDPKLFNCTGPVAMEGAP